MENDFNFRINSEYLEVVKDFERFTGETSSEYINGTIKNQIKFVLQNMNDSDFYPYVEEICKKLDIDLWGWKGMEKDVQSREVLSNCCECKYVKTIIRMKEIVDIELCE